MDIKEKMNLVLQLLNEIVEEGSKMKETETNKQISGLIRTFGKEHFVESITTLKVWVDDFEI